MPGNSAMRKLRGISLIETLCAVLVVAIVAAAAIATWGLSMRVVANKRVTEMASFLGSREIERLKAKTYGNLALTGAATVTYYDKNGTSSAVAVAHGYMVKSTVTTSVSRGASASSEDLNEIQVQVWDNTGTTRYDDGKIRTLLSTGGM